MIDAELKYATTLWSTARIAKYVGRRYSTVRDHLVDLFSDEFNRIRKSTCYSISKIGIKNPAYGVHPPNYIGLCKDGRGYLTVYKPDWFTGRKNSERIFHHHFVMCLALGITEIPKGFVIHHIDGIRCNNDLHNLALMTMSAHGKLHHLLKGSETIPKGSSTQEGTKRMGYVGLNKAA